MMNWSNPKAEAGPIAVNVASQPALLADLRSRMTARRGFAVATINLDHAVKLRNDPAFHQAYAAHSHVTADGNPIVWLERLAGRSEMRLTTGSDLIEPLAKLAAEIGVPVAFFGATEASLNAAKAELQHRLPDVEIVMTAAPAMGFDPDGSAADDAIQALRSSGAQLVFLALGAPKQERFAARASQALPQTGFVSIGAGLDFLSGRQHRAPDWMQKLALEWLWRLLQNPRRMAARYGACAALLPRLVWRALVARQS